MSDAFPPPAVIVGDSRVASALVRQAVAEGPVVHVGGEPGPPDPRIRFVRLGRDPRAALAEAGAAEARLVALDLGDDAQTLAALAALAETAPADRCPAIVAHLRDPALRRTVDINLQALGLTPRPRLVGMAELAAGTALAATRPYDLAYWRGQERLHAVLIGFSTLGRAAFEDLVLSGLAGDLAPPRILVLDPDPELARRRIAREMPEIGLSAEIVLGRLDPLTVAAADGPIVEAEGVAPLTLIVVALDDTATALATVGALARLQESEGQAVASVLVITEDARALFALARPAGRPRDLGRTWFVRGGIEAEADIAGLLTERADQTAQAIHEAYRSGQGRGSGADLPWADLPESLRRANRRAADHLPMKIWTLGIREPGGAGDLVCVEPHIHASVIAPTAASDAEDALMRRLARLEHDRWMVERRLDGWRFGDVRDDARRIHPKLISFDDPRFTAQDIEKDVEQVRFLFRDVVREAPDGLVTPLVLGILVEGASAGGIEVAAAMRLAEAEPWRPVVVVSALLVPAELDLLSELEAALATGGRSWRLVVPEVARDNRDVRAIMAAGDRARLSAVLDRPATRFAPIGGPVPVEDLWADPSAPDPHVERIAAYVSARCSAIVGGKGGSDVASA